ncbi:MAG TPA: M20/M25/M40 family metallo-hydrolase [Bacteroidales bacterium]|nr:M20/M25/M40 family metallo-hydrolase [Bacteroidales bacterium]
MQRIIVVFLILVSSALFAQIKRNANITNDELLYHVTFLASDSLKGRQPGTVQDKIAAKYIRDEFREYGLTLLGKKGYQFFDFKSFNPEFEKVTSLTKNGERLQLGRDFSAPTVNGSDSLCAKAIFVGKGDETSYQNVKVRRKWAVIYYPLDQKYEYLNPRPLEIAKKRGAAGIIIVSNDTLSKYIDVDFRTLPSLPIFILSPDASAKLLKPIGLLSDITKKINESSIVSQPLGINVCGMVAKLYNLTETQNVVAMLRGSDPKLADEYIVIGAHYDHLGMGEMGGSRSPNQLAIHNGADDNASGVAAMLEIAQKLASDPKKIKRSIMFVAFGAEEKGLIGSQRFVDSALIPIENIKAMINLDMVGRLRNRELEVHGSKTSLEADSILNALNSDSLFYLKLVPDGFGPSDHASFYSKNIPVFFFHTGLHEDYHTPNDDVALLNIDGMQNVSDYVFRLALELATMQKPLTFSKSSTRSLSSSRTPKIKVRLGIMPDVSGVSDDGLKVIGVTAGKPADIAGIQIGDLIIAINQKPIKNIYDYTQALSSLEPGTKASVKVLRDKVEIEYTVEL